MGFSELCEPRPGQFLWRRERQYAQFICISHMRTVQVELVGGYINSLAKDFISEAKNMFNFPYLDWGTNIASFLGESIEYGSRDDAYLSDSSDRHWRGLLNVSSAGQANTSRIVLPQNMDEATRKIEMAFSIYPSIFTEVLPRLDRDLPFKEIPSYLYHHTGFPALIACFARAVEIGCAKQQCFYAVEKVRELNEFHFPGCEVIIPLLENWCGMPRKNSSEY